MGALNPWIWRRSIDDIKALMSMVGIDINAATTTPKMERSAPGVTAQNERTRLNEVTGKILQTDRDLLWGGVGGVKSVSLAIHVQPTDEEVRKEANPEEEKGVE